MNEDKLKQIWQGNQVAPAIDFGAFQDHLDTWQNKLRKKAMMDSWIQVGAAGILVGLTLYNAKMVALSVFCIGVVIWYVRDLRKFYDWDYTESNSGDLRQSLNLKIAKLKGYFRRTRILMYAVMPLSVPAIFYAFGSFDPPAIKVWYWTFSLVQSLVMFEIISVVATEVSFALTYSRALNELRGLVKELESGQ